MSYQSIFDNIEYARRLVQTNSSVAQIVLVCGGPDERTFLEEIFCRHSSKLFNANSLTGISVFEERIGIKTRQGNFLGALLAYQRLKEDGSSFQKRCADSVVLMGMVFGRGERISPFSQIMGNRKALISVMSPRLMDGFEPLTSIEEAMHFFAPLAVALKSGGFRGILCKWGDETQIPSISLENLVHARSFVDSDVIKCVSQIPVTSETAAQKDWVIFESQNHQMLTQCSRNEKSVLDKVIDEWKSRSASIRAGVSLGPVAVSHRVLELASEIFHADIERDGVFLDFDPYVIQALGFDGDDSAWSAALAGDVGLQKIVTMMPDFFSKVKTLKQKFADTYGRPLKVEVLDLGSEVYWADIGQHAAFAEKVMAVNEQTPRGQIARMVEDIPDIPGLRDERGNLIIDAFVAPGVDIFNSVIIGSVITGAGSIVNSVIKNSLLHQVKIKNSFVLHSARLSVNMEDDSGLYRAVGARPVVLSAHERLGTLLTEQGPKDLKVSSVTDLKNKSETYDRIIFDNTLSFAQAFDIMRPVSMEYLEQLRRDEVAEVTETIVEQLFALLQCGAITEETMNHGLAVIALQSPKSSRK